MKIMKTLKTILAFALALSFLPTAVSAAGSLLVREEVMLQADAKKVWRKIRSFGDWQDWHPAVASTQLDGSGKDAGDTRILTLGDGAMLTEVLVDYNQDKMTYSYVISKGPLPVKGYYSKIWIEPVDGNSCKVVWASKFDSMGASDNEAKEAIRGVYTAGLGALEAMFN